MPHEDSGFPFAPPTRASGEYNQAHAADQPDMGGAADAEMDLLPDAAPRERARTTATPLHLTTQLPRDMAARADTADAGDMLDAEDWDDAEDAEDWDDAGDGPFAAPATARLEAVNLAPVVASVNLPALNVEPVAPPVVIPGARRLRRLPRHPFIARRQRPLTVSLLAFTIIGALLISGLVIAAPLSEALNASGGNPIQPFVGAASAANGVRFVWYTAHWGDTADSVAKAFHVALGGIYELNHLQAGDELLIGRQYMIPLDPAYGERYQPPAMLNVSAHYGNIRFGPNWWDSIAGTPPVDSPCAPNGGANELGYQLHAPNWGARWVRGYIVYGTWVYHTGVDLAAPQGNVLHAAQAGQVIWAGYDATNGLGWSVKIDHCNHVSTVYGHMMRLLVHTGDFVDVGSPVGLEGSTGNSTGPHLHFMVEWNNLWVNPMLFYASQAKIIWPS